MYIRKWLLLKITLLLVASAYVILSIVFLRAPVQSTGGGVKDEPREEEHQTSEINTDESGCSVVAYFTSLLQTGDCLRKKDTHAQKIVFKKQKVVCSVENIYRNCLVVKKFVTYLKDCVSTEEAAFPLAFALKIHTAPNQVFRLLRAIYRPHNVYCIHVDKKTPDTIYYMFKNISQCLPNIVVIDDRVTLVYSSIRQVEAELRCMDALEKMDTPWRYYINLAGQEFPLQTNADMVKRMKALNGRNHIESYSVGEDMLSRISTSWVIIRDKIVSSGFPKESLPKSIELRKGSAYGLFNRDFVRFILTDRLAAEIIQYLKDTFAPEETIWATLNHMSSAPGGSFDDVSHGTGTFFARAMLWSWEKPTCHGKYVRDVCIFSGGDVPWLLGRSELIANKFHYTHRDKALDCLEGHLVRNLVYQHMQTRNPKK